MVAVFSQNSYTFDQFKFTGVFNDLSLFFFWIAWTFSYFYQVDSDRDPFVLTLGATGGVTNSVKSFFQEERGAGLDNFLF